MADETSNPIRRAHGRALSDFPDLSDAEKDFVQKTRLGIFCVMGESVPEGATLKNTIRAGLIRFLALGGDEAAPVHEKGVQLEGAWVAEGREVSFLPKALILAFGHLLP